MKEQKRGRGRPRKDRTRKQLKLDNSLILVIEQIAETTGDTMSNVVNDALSRGLPQILGEITLSEKDKKTVDK